MRTPDGIECKHFYGDYYRGRELETCRLITDTKQASEWNHTLCRTCPVPGILRSNACENMSLSAKISPGFLGTRKHISVTAYCHKAEKIVKEPEIGCGLCHPLPPEWK